MMDMYALLMGGSGGGGGLPTPTASDFGAGLCVVKTPVEGAVIVPEQTANYDEDAGAYVLTNTNVALFTEGAKVIMTVGNYSGIATVTDEGGLGAVVRKDADYGAGIYLDGETMYAWYDRDDAEYEPTITVKCSLANYTYGWGIDPYVGYDVVIKLDKAVNIVTVDDLHLLKGSYADCVAKMWAGEPITGLLYYTAITEDDPDYANSHTYPVNIDGTNNYGDYVTFVAAGVVSPKTIYLTESGLALSI